jgi:hypothetical protein
MTTASEIRSSCLTTSDDDDDPTVLLLQAFLQAGQLHS